MPWALCRASCGDGRPSSLSASPSLLALPAVEQPELLFLGGRPDPTQHGQPGPGPLSLCPLAPLPRARPPLHTISLVSEAHFADFFLLWESSLWASLPSPLAGMSAAPPSEEVGSRGGTESAFPLRGAERGVCGKCITHHVSLELYK